MARELGVAFLSKSSPTLLRDLRSFLSTAFGFGDLVLTDQRTAVETRIQNINQLFTAAADLPEDVLAEIEKMANGGVHDHR